MHRLILWNETDTLAFDGNKLLLHGCGKQTVVDIMVMMDSFIVDMGRERRLAQPLHQMIRLVAVLTMLHKNFFSRKAVMKNGSLVGTVFKDIKGPLFPTIAVHSQNEEVQVNFGWKKFAFDLKAR
ncbi:hypothetical protein JRO89_XS15G0062600 [Xanthoceras sorbifolium]|uniref:Uncharacterized protein n=1 Tax=Xanthoceras sorbifolium TaxID=99658 RepID=A0ABQ8H138_9ROSI|nr:hypothetical protein JRO89_XS15G0062600 [Xanthoceras sorbifolium]